LKTTLLVIAALLGNPQAKSAAHTPKPAPASYVSRQFGLAMKVPAGLSICPLARKWSGTEDGTVLFLEPPAACVDSPASPSSNRQTSAFTPHIQLRYRSNEGRYDNYDGDIPAPRTSEDLARFFCPKFTPSPQIKLFGQPALTCRSLLAGDRVRLVLMAVYGSGHKVLLVTLLTTKERQTADESVLANVAGGIIECKASSAIKEELPACPNGSTW
jgi:hypothetical protein